MTLSPRADASPSHRPDAQASPDRKERATITLELADEARFREVLRAAIDAASVELDVEVRSAASGDSTPSETFQVTVREAGEWYDIDVVDVTRDRLYTRRIAREAGEGDEVAHEAAAHVIAYALQALGRGQTIGTPRQRSPGPRVDAPPPSTASGARPPLSVADPPAEAPSTRPRFAFGTRASITAHASNAPAVFGVGGMAVLRFPYRPGRSAFEIAASLEQHVPTEVRSSNLSSRFRMHNARIWARYDRAVGRTVGIGPAIGLGVDRIGVTTGPRAGGPDPTISSHDVIGIAAMAFGARAAIASRLRLQIDLGIELPWHHVEYVVQRGARTLTFLDPWPVRPWASLGLMAEL